MSIPNHLATTEVVLLEVEIFITIIAIGAWGGFVSYLIRRDKQEGDDHSHKGIMHCLTQVVVSCFTSGKCKNSLSDVQSIFMLIKVSSLSLLLAVLPR